MSGSNRPALAARVFSRCLNLRLFFHAPGCALPQFSVGEIRVRNKSDFFHFKIGFETMTVTNPRQGPGACGSSCSGSQCECVINLPTVWPIELGPEGYAGWYSCNFDSCLGCAGCGHTNDCVDPWCTELVNSLVVEILEVKCGSGTWKTMTDLQLGVVKTSYSQSEIVVTSECE